MINLLFQNQDKDESNQIAPTLTKTKSNQIEDSWFDAIGYPTAEVDDPPYATNNSHEDSWLDASWFDAIGAPTAEVI
jgi:hypothetical protein